MVTSINLGNISEQNGKTVVTGSSSGGLDTKALLEALTAAKRLPAVQLEERIDLNTKKTAAFSELQQLLTSFKDASNFLRNAPGVANQSTNIFEYRGATITNDGPTPGSNYLSVTAGPGADVSSYSVTVDQLATFNTKITNTFALADTNTASAVGGGGEPFTSGAFTVGSAGVNVTLDDGDTLEQVVDKINAVKNQSKVTASIIQVSPGNYRLSLKTTETGAALNYASPATTVGYAIETDAVDAQMTIDGTTITRSNNSISDVVDGLTFNLLAQSPVADTLSVNVNADTELVKEAIYAFVNSYNDLRIFAAKQSETGPDGLPTEDALLGSNSTMKTVLQRVATEISTVVDGIGAGMLKRLSDVGIELDDYPGDAETPEVKNILTIDDAKLSSAISSKFEEVRDLFEFDYTSDDPDLVVFQRTNSLNATSVSLNIDQTNGIYEASYDNGGGMQTVQLDMTPVSGGGGIVLRGQQGTALEGLVLIYNNTGDATVQLDMTQGIGDRVYNTLDSVLKPDVGAVSVELKAITENSSRMQTEIERIDAAIERYRESLLLKFSALESAIASANILLQSLSAQANARLAASGG